MSLYRKRRKPPKKDPASIEKEKMLTTPAEMPHSTHAVIPVLQPRTEAEVEAEPVDPEDASVTTPPPPREGEGVQATHITPPATEGQPIVGNVHPEELDQEA